MKTVNISLTNDQYEGVMNLSKEMGFANRSELFRALLRYVLRKPEVLSETEELIFEPFKKLSIEAVEKDLRSSGKYNDDFIKSVTKGLKASKAYEGK